MIAQTGSLTTGALTTAAVPIKKKFSAGVGGTWAATSVVLKKFHSSNPSLIMTVATFYSNDFIDVEECGGTGWSYFFEMTGWSSGTATTYLAIDDLM